MAGGGTGITATPAATKTLAGHSATFVRSASGIINETNRVNLDRRPQNAWTSADVYLQFRPTDWPSGTGSPTPNPTCDPVGLVTLRSHVNDNPADPAIAGTPTNGLLHRNEPVQRVCLSGESVGASGTIDSACLDGTTATLPTASREVPDRRVRHVDQQHHNIADAEYTSRPSTVGRPTMDGYDIDPCSSRRRLRGRAGQRRLRGLGRVQREPRLQPHHAAHRLGEPRRLRRRQQHEHEGRGWYGDNSGSLNYTITYVGCRT